MKPQADNPQQEIINTIDRTEKTFLVNNFIDLDFKLITNIQVNTMNPINIKNKLIVVNVEVKSYPPYK